MIRVDPTRELVTVRTRRSPRIVELSKYPVLEDRRRPAESFNRHGTTDDLSAVRCAFESRHTFCNGCLVTTRHRPSPQHQRELADAGVTVDLRTTINATEDTRR